MAKETYKCYGCKQFFRKEELVEHASNRAKELHRYCPKCLKEKQDSEFFADKICEIFGIKAPGPLIYTQRKRIKQEYGYTDQTIIDCLEYIYNVEWKKKLSESLYFVKPEYVEKMLKYKQNKETEEHQIVNAIGAFKTEEHIVPIKEIENNKTSVYDNIDEWLNDD